MTAKDRLGTIGIRIECPPMKVRNTGWSPSSDRMADELPCKGSAWIGASFYAFDVIFPSTPVKRISAGLWMVDPCVAGNEEGSLEISYPQEPVERRGWRTMAALAIDNEVEKSWIILGGVRYGVYAPLKETLADSDLLFGLFSYTVRATTINGHLLE